MKLSDYLRLGWDQLKRRIVVTVLCAAGIAIGSASIVVALAFGESINHYSRQQMSYYLKSDEITLRSGRPPGETNAATSDPAAMKPYALTKAKLELIRTLPHVKAVASYQTLNSFQFEVDHKRGYLNQIYATDLSTLTAFGYELQQGGPSELDNTIILSYGATMGLLDEQTAKSSRIQGGYRRDDPEARDAWLRQATIAYPVNQKQITLIPQINRPNGSEEAASTSFPLRVVGILKKPEGLPDDVIMGQKTAFVSPALGKRLENAIYAVNGGKTQSGSGEPADGSDFNEVKIKADSSTHVKELETQLQKLKLSVETNLRQEERMQSEFVIVRLIFAGAGLFILFVASISIIVAMTMSTYQRRRQIGIMKVLGANLKQIRNMFMVESALLGGIGGVAGIVLSYWVIWGINIAIIKLSPPRPGGSQEILFISLWILPVGLFFAVLTGVLSGIYPAVKASRTDALTAIKRE